jgi:anthranilate phosphoribosyltransferase
MLTTPYVEHPFAKYIRILGKGKQGARPLTQEEAQDAMRMIMAEEVETVQLGAFLMLMRVKEETPAELAGFVRAVRDTFPVEVNQINVDLDWSSYAGKRRHLPWFLLSTLLLVENGVSVFMHGAGGHTAGRIYTEEVLRFLGIEYAKSFAQAAEQLAQYRFAYLPLSYLSPKLQHILELRPLMGLRSPVHTVARLLNPFEAPYVMQGIFHPGYRPVHQEAALLLNQPHLAVLKGEGGEIERDPDIECLVQSVHEGVRTDQIWPPLFKQRHVKEEKMDPQRLSALWRGELKDEYAIGAVTSTTAVALKLMGKADSIESAQALAEKMWAERPKVRYGVTTAAS